ncbi:putative transcriptional regulatory protein [Mycobacterium kansasii]|uniref:Putative transcriptional regulatory protein n=1 Tax=Mycobacterium kansasii TaxID=1768 RepID=A0A1V3WRC5_MYCKA|nr:putative transcriptional regulatory protein [Mycobacterium kansasii]
MLLREFVDYWQHLLTEGDFTAGCPVAAAALGSADDGLELSTEAGTILNGWCSALTRAFITDGFGESDAAALAVTSVAALEGAIMLCRSTHTAEPLRTVGDQLQFLVASREFVRSSGSAANHNGSGD